MSFWEKVKQGFVGFMQGRNGPDQLCNASIWTGLALYLLAMLFGLPLLDLLGLGLWIYGLFRMLSRNTAKRFAENQRYLQAKNKAVSSIKQFIERLKGRKQYRYFVCPQCKTRLRLPRGVGEVNVHCKQCGHTFPAKG